MLPTELEAAILTEWDALRADRSVDELARDIETLTIDSKISELVNQFPATDYGSKFIGTYFTLRPQLVVKKRNIQPVHKEECPGNLLYVEVAKALKNKAGEALQVGTLCHDTFGTITKEPRSLVIRNIRLVKEDEGTEQKVPAGRVLIDKDIDYTPHDSRQRSYTLFADVEFGTCVLKGHQITIQTLGYDASTEWVIPLPPLIAKVACDGSVTLENGTRFMLEPFLAEKQVQCAEVSLKEHFRHVLDIDVYASYGR